MASELTELARLRSMRDRAIINANRQRQEAAKRERQAVETLENYVALCLNMRLITLTEVARELNVSRDKVRGMQKRANDRNRKLLRSGY